MKSFLIAFIGELALFAQLSLFAQYRVTVPYVKENGKITINAEVNGYQGRFLVDTGAPCSLTYSFMQRAGIVPFDSVQVQDSNGHLLTTRVAELESLKLNGFTFSRLQAICLEKGNIVENFKIDGVIGYNLMKMGIVKLDGSNHTFTLTSSEKGLGIDSLCGIPLVKDPYLVRIPVRFADNEQDTVMFDSGASSFYSMSATSHRRLSKKYSKSFEQLGKGVGILSLGVSGVEKASTKYRLKIPHFSIGNHSFRNVTTITTHAMDSRIGSGLLNHGNIVINYRKGMFYYIPSVSGETPDMYQKEWDAVITVIDNYLTVGMVWNPEESSLKGGERIVEIEGKKYDKVDLYKATTTNLVQLPEKEAHIKYIDKETGEIKSTVIRRK
ncbi:MAG: retropepsin-like domain-containing protein [Bacteroides acidifaciens]|uniref:retropepsin-like aspartic protease n=1 Tax=Bacteroides acidifaciens TaxID=85831 RepID=UPI0023D24204|nr:retropepsin-like aspartic protease [Bacteroides acidifaciens]MDE6819691.1 retropepsin-like domain-containing protein [Bacteroides acidifaciens]MDE6988984.1 retropepsin-like domain-containing protein [Bacteroides acidifaciens]